MQSGLLTTAGMEIQPVYLPVAGQQPENSDTRLLPETLESILALPLQWHFSRSAGGKRASLATCTDNRVMLSNSIRKQRWLLKGGTMNGQENSDNTDIILISY
jgi:hypothetical protein